jgi:hypothetical protein
MCIKSYQAEIEVEVLEGKRRLMLKPFHVTNRLR